MGFDGTTLSDPPAAHAGNACQPGGIILFKRNIEEAAQTHALLRDAQKAVATPMFLCVDMEGGTVDRLRDVIAPAPSVAEVAAPDRRSSFASTGDSSAKKFARWASIPTSRPSLDLGFEASKSVLSSRTVSDEPKETIRYAREFLRGLARLQGSGLRQAFPRAGRSAISTAITICPSIDKPWKRLWDEDLLPYRELRSELPFVMVAHAAYPEVTGDGFRLRFRRSG